MRDIGPAFTTDVANATATDREITDSVTGRVPLARARSRGARVGGHYALPVARALDCGRYANRSGMPCAIDVDVHDAQRLVERRQPAAAIAPLATRPLELKLDIDFLTCLDPANNCKLLSSKPFQIRCG